MRMSVSIEREKQLTLMPPLESGDRLTLCEFRRRYEAMPNLKKAELVEGVVYVPSPVRFIQHGQPHSDVMTWLGAYRAATPFVLVGGNSTVRLDADNEPQPDALLRIGTEAGGRSSINEGYVAGPPELIAEIVASSAAYDLHDKKHAYRRTGVVEYLVWITYEQRIDWFVLNEGDYNLLQPNSRNIFQSPTFPGLWLDAQALLAGDLSKVLAVLQQGLKTEEHRSFIAKLTERANTE